MYFHIFIDNSINPIKLNEELDFLRLCIKQEPWYKEHYNQKQKLFKPDAKEVAQLWELKTSSALFPPFETKSGWGLEYSSKEILNRLGVHVADAEMFAIQILPTDLAGMAKEIGTFKSLKKMEIVTKDTFVIASNNIRYDAYRDYPELVTYITKDGMAPEILLRKAIVYALNQIFEPNEVIRKRIVSKYLLGSTF